MVGSMLVNPTPHPRARERLEEAGVSLEAEAEDSRETMSHNELS